jgi:hypothetical protein
MRSAPATYCAAASLFKGDEKNLRPRCSAPTGSAFDVPADRHGFCLWRSAFPIAKVSLVRSFVPHFAGRLSKIQSRSLSPVEVTKAELDRIAVLDPKLKSYATVMADSAMAGKTGGD